MATTILAVNTHTRTKKDAIQDLKDLNLANTNAQSKKSGRSKKSSKSKSSKGRRKQKVIDGELSLVSQLIGNTFKRSKTSVMAKPNLVIQPADDGSSGSSDNSFLRPGMERPGRAGKKKNTLGPGQQSFFTNFTRRLDTNKKGRDDSSEDSGLELARKKKKKQSSKKQKSIAPGEKLDANQPSFYFDVEETESGSEQASSESPKKSMKGVMQRIRTQIYDIVVCENPEERKEIEKWVESELEKNPENLESVVKNLSGFKSTTKTTEGLMTMKTIINEEDGTKRMKTMKTFVDKETAAKKIKTMKTFVKPDHTQSSGSKPDNDLTNLRKDPQLDAVSDKSDPFAAT